MSAYFYLLLYFVALALLFFPACNSTEQESSATQFSAITETNHGAENRIIGTILDCSSRDGKEERVAMEMAIDELNNQKQNHNKLILRVKCSPGVPLHAAQAARHLIKKSHVQAILGPDSWEQSSAAAEVANQFNVPILSFSGSTPPWATTRWPLFVQASPTTSNQMKAVAAIVQSSNWHRVNVIYEDDAEYSSDILNHLYGAFQDADVQVSSLVPLPTFSSLDAVHEELQKLKRGQCRVFVVHASLALAERLFNQAKELKMLEKEYVWITTDSITSLVHSMNLSVVSSMQGVLGVRSYVPDRGPDFHAFYVKFLEKFRKNYPEEKNHDPGIFALQAYDATRAVGSSIINSVIGSKNNSQKILEKIEEMDFDGLSRKIQFKERKLAPLVQFQIINIIGRSYMELGFWSEGLGFSKVINNNASSYSVSMEILGHVFWPGGPWSTPRGWVLPTISNPLRIGVPNGSLTKKFVNIGYDPINKYYTFSGFSIEVFNKTVQNLEYSLPCEFIPFNGNYTELVQQVQLKNFDAAVGDIAITSRRYEYVEFTHAHTESGLVMVVPIKKYSNRAWLFMKPFTKAMWLLTALIYVYNGFVIWSIEREHLSEIGMPLVNQIGHLLWLAFATLFALNGEKLHSNLSKMATIVWLFVSLIITQSYTASLTSMLTVQRIEPKIANIETLKSENAFIGCSRMSFVKTYFKEALKFNPNNIKNFVSPEEYAKALRSGEISAAFLEVPVAKLFVAKYCKSFTIAGPTYKVGGYGFAFPRGSLLLPDIDKALLNVFENGVVKELETSLIASEKCVDIQVDNETASLSPHSFFVLFIFTGGTSTAALAIYYFRSKQEVVDSMAEHRRIWILILMVMKKWRYQRNRMSRKVTDLESPVDSPTR